MATRAPAKKASPSRTATRSPAKTTRSVRQKDACDLLDADHKAVRKLFDEFESLTESRARSAQARKRALAERICTELTVHALIEEEIFYPAARAAIKDKALLNEATVEHASAKDLIAQIRGMDEGSELFDATVQVLGEYVDHHVKEERNELFPKVRQTRLNLVALREALEERKAQLMAQMSPEAETEAV